MSEPRLAPRLEAQALIRRAESEGGFGAILGSGDDRHGTLLLVIRERGQLWGCRERLFGASGRYEWQAVGPAQGEAESALSDYLARRRRADPDNWLIELDVADGERFVAETSATG